MTIIIVVENVQISTDKKLMYCCIPAVGNKCRRIIPHEPCIDPYKGDQSTCFVSWLSRVILPLQCKKILSLDQLKPDSSLGKAKSLYGRIQEVLEFSYVFSANKNFTCCIVFDIAAVGTVLFETRFGSFSKSPSLETTKFIDSAHSLFRLFLKFVLFPAWIDKFYRFKSVQEFYDHMDILHNFGDMCINKKMREIQGRLDKEDIQDEDAAEFLTFLISREDISFKEITANLIGLLFPAVETVCIRWKV